MKLTKALAVMGIVAALSGCKHYECVRRGPPETVQDYLLIPAQVGNVTTLIPIPSGTHIETPCLEEKEVVDESH